MYIIVLGILLLTQAEYRKNSARVKRNLLAQADGA
jgi:hypothetical protein